jgi:CBS domain-containing protein
MSETIKSLITLLNDYAPFKQMEEQDLAYLLENSTLRYYPQDTVILSPQQGKVDKLYILKQGLIRGERTLASGESENVTFEISQGECFPLAALVGERGTRTTHIASEDSFCLVCDKQFFVTIFARSVPFRDFCLRGISTLLDQVNRHIKTQAQMSLSDQFSLDTELQGLSSRKPVTCTPETPARTAVAAMHDMGVGSIIIARADQVPLGIFTLRDLRRIVADPQTDLNTPIQQFMSGNPVSLPGNATAFEAALLMARHHFAHLVIVEKGKLTGVISERDLFSLQRVNLVHIARTLANAPSIEALANMQVEVGHLTETMIAHGATAEQINRLVTLLNDYTTRQAIRLCIKEHGDPGIEFSWLCFGSAGRREQTMLTDQDNGIIFDAADATQAAAIRLKLLPLAAKVNAALARCGFTLCPGNIMASNPKLCLSRMEWQTWFDRFIDAATPQNLLNSCIYFDLRVQWGQNNQIDGVWDHISERIRLNSLFQRMLAEAALQRRPPLGMFSHFVTQKAGDVKGVDLKKEGLSPFVDAARVLSLAHGIRETSTLGRLRALAEAGVLEKQDVNAWDEACQFIQLLRLRWQLAAQREGRELSNLVPPSKLNQLDQRILKEAFRQAQRLQRKLAWSYQI